MPIPANDDRRKEARQACEHDYLEVEGRHATLVDWSFGGLGVRFDGPPDIKAAEEIDIRIFDPATDQWENLEGVVRWINEDGMVGVEFKQTDQRTVGILLRLLGNQFSGLRGT